MLFLTQEPAKTWKTISEIFKNKASKEEIEAAITEFVNEVIGNKIKVLSTASGGKPISAKASGKIKTKIEIQNSTIQNN